jgi:hypothetical protein
MSQWAFAMTGDRAAGDGFREGLNPSYGLTKHIRDHEGYLLVPDGQITNVPRTLSGRLVKPSLKKYSAFQNIRIILYSPLSRPTKRGVS